MTIESFLEGRRFLSFSKSVGSRLHDDACTAGADAGTIEEDQLARTFQQIVNCVDMDDDGYCGGNGGGGMSASSSSRKPSDTLVPSATAARGHNNNNNGNAFPTPSKSFEFNFASFLDDEWVPVVKRIPLVEEQEQEEAEQTQTQRQTQTTQGKIDKTAAPSGFVSSATGVAEGRRFIEPSRSLTPFSTYSSKPPRDYVCKLCNCSGHWIKDCRLYQPRSSASLKSFGSGNGSANASAASTGLSAARSNLPPANYICRLCNVSGHWIDQCAKFQPKHQSQQLQQQQQQSATEKCLTLPPGMGPTPNYRPPAYLSKPVPSNYLCNLCNNPGHWIQQCPQFTPIIRRK